MSDTDDLAAIEEALTRMQRLSLARARVMNSVVLPLADIRQADAAILALERIRARLANSVPAEQATFAIDTE